MHSLLSHPSLIHCRRLFLKDYEVYINIGVHDFEKRAEQRVIFNVEIYVPLELNTPKQDRLEEVLDYDFIRKTIVERVKRGKVRLRYVWADSGGELIFRLAEQLGELEVSCQTARGS